MDVLLPLTHEYEATRRVRCDTVVNIIPVLPVALLPLGTYKIGAHSAHYDTCVSKQFNVLQLRVEIREYLVGY